MNTVAAVVKPGAEKEFYRRAVDWEAATAAQLAKSERRAWMVAGVACAVAITAIGGIVLLAPLRRVVPMVFAVDKATGDTELVNAVDNRTVAQLGYQELLDKHWSTRYVLARESYFYRLLQTDYDTVLMLSADDVGRDYAQIFEGASPRDKTLGPQTQWKVTILSVRLEHDSAGNRAVVRFEREQRRLDADRAEAPQYFVATMSYEYKPSMFGKEKDLIENPLGFRVTSYRVDAELAPATAAG